MRSTIAATLLLLASTHASMANDCAPASSTEVEQMRQKLDSVLSDAPSARFKDVCLSNFGTMLKPPQKVYCGLLNQKNSFGAFAGYRKFGYISGGKRVPAIVSDRMADIAIGSPERPFATTYCTICGHDDECKDLP
jgi:hypothetical protein